MVKISQRWIKISYFTGHLQKFSPTSLLLILRINQLLYSILLFQWVGWNLPGEWTSLIFLTTLREFKVHLRVCLICWPGVKKILDDSAIQPRQIYFDRLSSSRFWLRLLRIPIHFNNPLKLSDFENLVNRSGTIWNSSILISGDVGKLFHRLGPISFATARTK